MGLEEIESGLHNGSGHARAQASRSTTRALRTPRGLMRQEVMKSDLSKPLELPIDALCVGFYSSSGARKVSIWALVA